MTMKALSKKMSDAELRIESVLSVAGMTSVTPMAKPLRTFFEDEDDDTIKRCCPVVTKALLREREDDADYFINEIPALVFNKDRLGFLVQFATPVMTHKNMRATYSWGYYGTYWLYADTIEEAIEAGLAWAAERREKEKSKGSPLEAHGEPHG